MKKIILLILAIAFISSSCSTITGNKKLTANIKTSRGEIVLELYGAETPLTCASFVNLANRGYYDGLKFHRVIENFMVQGGDPTGTGSGGPGYKFEDEVVSTLKHSEPGIFSMANAGPKTNGSQFFITHIKTDWLDGKHTVFGKVTTGLDIVNSIQQGDIINSITISGDIPEEMKKIQNRVDEWNKILDEKFPKLKEAENL